MRAFPRVPPRTAPHPTLHSHLRRHCPSLAVRRRVGRLLRTAPRQPAYIKPQIRTAPRFSAFAPTYSRTPGCPGEGAPRLRSETVRAFGGQQGRNLGDATLLREARAIVRVARAEMTADAPPQQL